MAGWGPAQGAGWYQASLGQPKISKEVSVGYAAPWAYGLHPLGSPSTA